MPLRTLLLSATLIMAGAAAFAQEPSPSGPTERNIDSAGSFRNITTTGVTKPPGTAAAPKEERSDATQGQRKLDRKIGSGICVGCD